MSSRRTKGKAVSLNISQCLSISLKSLSVSQSPNDFQCLSESLSICQSLLIYLCVSQCLSASQCLLISLSLLVPLNIFQCLAMSLSVSQYLSESLIVSQFSKCLSLSLNISQSLSMSLSVSQYLSESLIVSQFSKCLSVSLNISQCLSVFLNSLNVSQCLRVSQCLSVSLNDKMFVKYPACINTQIALASGPNKVMWWLTCNDNTRTSGRRTSFKYSWWWALAPETCRVTLQK